MNWIMKAFAEAYSTALFVTPDATQLQNRSGRTRRTCARERVSPQPRRR